MTTKKPAIDVDGAMQGLAHRTESAEFEREAQRDLAAIEVAAARDAADYTTERDQINQLLGEVSMSHTLAKFAAVVSLSKLAYIKENKLYQRLKGTVGVDRQGEIIHDIGTWAGFCRAVGSSAGKVDEDLSNLKALGEEAMDSLNRIGAGYRDIRRLRKLSPEDQAAVVAEAEASGDKETLIELIDELTSRHNKEKESLEKQNEKLQRKVEMKTKDAEQKDERILDLEEQVKEHEQAQRLETSDEQAGLEQLRRWHLQIKDVADSINLLLTTGRLAESPKEIQIMTAQLCDYLVIHAGRLRADVSYAIPETLGELPPVPNVIQDMVEDESAARERLEKALGIGPLN